MNKLLRPTIVIAEMHYSKSHLKLNERYIDLISTFADIILVTDGEYFRSKFDTIKTIKIKRFYSKRIDYLKYFLHVLNLVQIAWKIRKIDYSSILFLSIHSRSLLKCLGLFKKNSIVAFHHYDIDRMLNSDYETNLFNKRANKFKHLVLASFIKEGLCKKTSVLPENVYIVNQPKIVNSQERELKKRDIVLSIGQAYNSILIDELIEKILSTNTELRYKLVIRTKNKTLKDKDVELFSGFLEREAYDELFTRAVAILITYPDTYQLRYSGVIDDALSKGIPVICNDLPISRYFSKLYPHSCKIFLSINELIEILKNPIDSENSDFRNFELSRTDSIIISQLEQALK